MKRSDVTGYLSGSDSKESGCNVGDQGSIPGLERSPGEQNGSPFQYPYLENSMDRGVWWATVHGCHRESGTTERLTFSLSGKTQWEKVIFKETMFEIYLHLSTAL